MKSPALWIGLAMIALFSATPASAQVAGQHGIFKITVTLPVQRIQVGAVNDTVVTKSLLTNDIINLSQGRALLSKIDAKHEVLAADVTFEDGGMAAAKSTIVIYDPTLGGKAGIKLVVAKLNEVQFVTGYTTATTKGFGVGKATFNATTLGDPTKAALLSGEISGQGSSAGSHIFTAQKNTTAAAACTFFGPFKFRYVDAKKAVIDWDGFVLKGTATLSGKSIGNYVEL